MTKTIEKLCYGNLEPVSNYTVADARVTQLECLSQRNLDRLEKCLNKEQRETLRKYTECMQEYQFVLSELAFASGYCLVTRLAAEALIGAEKAAQSP